MWPKNFNERLHWHHVTPRGGEWKLVCCQNQCTKSSQILHSKENQQILFHSNCPNAFQWGRQPQTLPLPLEDLHPHGFSNPLDLAPKWHRDRFSCFRRAHKRDRQTDRETDHITWCSIRLLLLAITVIQHKNNNNINNIITIIFIIISTLRLLWKFGAVNVCIWTDKIN